MERQRILQDHLSVRIGGVHLLLFAATLPFDRFYSEVVLISYLVHTLIQFKWWWLDDLKNWRIMLVPAIYLANMLFTIYSNDKGEAYSEWMKQLALLLIPLFFFINPTPVRQYKDLILNVFALSCVLTIVYLYFDALHTIAYYKLPFKTLFSQTFMNHNFSLPIELHATYLSMYLVLSFMYVFDSMMQKKNAIRKWLSGVCLFILLCGLVQLASRTAFIYFLTFYTFVIPFYYFRNRNRFIAFVASLVISAGVLVVMMQADAFEYRYVTGIRSDLSLSKNVDHTGDPRAQRWSLAFQLAKEAPLLGYGAGSETRILDDVYFRHQLYDSFIHHLNAHNQYLSFLLKGGIIGVIIYLIVLFFGLRIAIIQRNIVFTAFILLLMTVSITENILDVNKGIFFYSFFFSFFLVNKPFVAYRPKMKQPESKRKRLYSIIDLH